MYEDFPKIKICLKSPSEAVLIDGGRIYSERGGVKSVPISLHYGAKTGDRFVHVEGVELRYDEDGELLKKGKTTIELWPLGHRSTAIEDSSLSVSTLQPGHIENEVIFTPVACSQVNEKAMRAK